MQKLRQALTPAILLIAPFAFAEPEVVPLEMFTTEDSNLEVTLWAQTPMFNNPTNMDIDKDGRIWVAEGVNYRRHTTFSSKKNFSPHHLELQYLITRLSSR